MAENKEKGLLGNLGIKAKAYDGMSFELFPNGAWKSLKTIWAENLSRIVIISFIATLFFAPAIAWLAVSNMIVGNVSAAIPYNLFDFIGYPSPTAMTDGLMTAEIVGTALYFENALLKFSVLIPCIAVGAVGLGGMFQVSRIFAYRQTNENMFKHLFVGVARTWLPALITGLVAGVFVFLFGISIFMYGIPVVLKVFICIFAGILAAFFTMWCLNTVSLASSYKMSLGNLLGDGMKITIATPVRELIQVFFIALGVGFMIFTKYVISSFYLVSWVLMFMLGLFFYVSLSCAHTHQIFDTYINNETASRAQAAVKEKEMAARERKRQERIERKASGEQPKQKAQPQAKFVNPKKKKKGEGAQEEAVEAKPKAPKQTFGYSESELKQIEEDRKAVLSGAESKDDGFDASAYEDEE